MKNLALIFIASLALFSCSEDEKITPKDYGTYTFEADMAYDSDSESETYRVYTQQTYFAFGTEETVATGTYNTDSWVDFNLMEDGISVSPVESWNIVFTNYTTNLGTEAEPTPYAVTGVLTNNNVTVAKFEYTDSDVAETISEAFAAYSTSDVTNLEFSSEADAIGYNWKSYDSSTRLYTVHSNYFYIVKTSANEYYKLRFVSFYGSSTSERIITMEYALMQ